MVAVCSRCTKNEGFVQYVAATCCGVTAGRIPPTGDKYSNWRKCEMAMKKAKPSELETVSGISKDLAKKIKKKYK